VPKKNKRDRQADLFPDGWETAERVKRLLQNRWNGSRSALAKALHMSVTSVIKVVTGQQQPGRQLLTAIVKNSDVNATWLLTGRGSPYTSVGIPVVNQVVPGPSLEHAQLLTDQRLPDLGNLYRPTCYWLKMAKGDAMVREKGCKLQAGDLLLLETDKAFFPPVEELWDSLCAVQVPKANPPVYKLAEVSYYGPSPENAATLSADTFDHGPRVITETVVREYPDGEMKAFKRRVREAPGTGSRKPREAVPVHHPGSHYHLQITYADIVAVCILMVRPMHQPEKKGADRKERPGT